MKRWMPKGFSPPLDPPEMSDTPRRRMRGSWAGINAHDESHHEQQGCYQYGCTAIEEPKTAPDAEMIHTMRWILDWAKVHISNADPRCAEFGDQTRETWTTADEGGERCDECTGCSGVMIVQAATAVLAATSAEDMRRLLVEAGIFKSEAAHD